MLIKIYALALYCNRGETIGNSFFFFCFQFLLVFFSPGP